MKVCIVQARIGSTRLPGKVLLPLNGHTVLGEVLTRCKQIEGIDRVICAIPDTIENNPVGLEAEKYCAVSRGPEHDVLSRYVIAAGDATHIMRITADCPLISPGLCSDVLASLLSENADYASNIEPRTFPQGFDCEVFTAETLQKAHYHSDGSHEREHVTTWMRSANIRRVNVASPWKLDGRLTLDTWDDYQAIRASFPDERLRAA